MSTKKLIVSLTARHRRDWQNKIKEIKKYRLREVALFMEILPPAERKGLLDALTEAGVKKIPLVHIRNDNTKKELDVLYKKFGARYFTIHEFHFKYHIIRHWRNYYKNLYLEMTTDNHVSPKVKVEKIGGFCMDLAHYKKQVTLQDEEYLYIIEHLKTAPTGCNHLSGYSYKRNKDLHHVSRAREFEYIKTLPHNLFGKVIAFEIFNPLKDQLRFYPAVKRTLQHELGFKII